MYFYILTFFVGTTFLQFFKQLPDLFWVLLLLIMMFVCSLFFKYFKIIFIFLLGFTWCLFYAHQILDWSLPKSLEGKYIPITGYISSLPQIEQYCEKFTIATDHINNKPQRTKIQLSWYNDYPEIQIGDKWQLSVKLKRPHGSMNPGGFDYEKYLFQNKIRATGYVKSGTLNYRLGSHWYIYPIGRFRQYLEQGIYQTLHNSQLQGVIAALVIGSRNGISADEWQVFRNTGTSHLVAISGLHIGLVSEFIFLFLNFIWRRIPYLTLRLPAPFAAAISALIGALIYSAIAGFSVPTQRALVMIAVFTLVLICKCNVRPWSALLIALLSVLIINPLSTLSAGFWLSFSAVALLIYCFSGRLGITGAWWKWGRAQLVVMLGLMPLCLLLFQQFSLISFMANFIAIPVVGFAVVPLSLVGCLIWVISTHLGTWILLFAERIMSLLWLYLKWLSAQHWVVWHHAIVNNWILVTTTIGVLLLLAPRGVLIRLLGIIWILPLVFYKPIGPKTGEVWFTLLDVGQGLASIVRTCHHVLIYDTGPKYSDNFDTGKTVVVPFLYNFGINNADMMVISHGDNDHIGGAASVLSMSNVKQIMTSVPQRFPNYHAEHCWAGNHWQWDGVTFSFLSPKQNSNLKGNDASCVLKVTNGENSVLLTGDIEALTEHILVKNNCRDLQSTILVAPHHGSNSSSTKTFINMVKPKYVLFPVGYLNRFAFPNKKVMIRYKMIYTVPFDTVNSGAITFKFNNKDKIFLPFEYRKLFTHYWNSG
jgi:competence protein ComEC